MKYICSEPAAARTREATHTLDTSTKPNRLVLVSTFIGLTLGYIYFNPDMISLLLGRDSDGSISVTRMIDVGVVKSGSEIEATIFAVNSGSEAWSVVGMQVVGFAVLKTAKGHQLNRMQRLSVLLSLRVPVSPGFASGVVKILGMNVLTAVVMDVIPKRLGATVINELIAQAFFASEGCLGKVRIVIVLSTQSLLVGLLAKFRFFVVRSEACD